jgi:hypothetical protein
MILRPGGVPERLNGAVSKTVVGLTVHRGFESLPLRFLGFGEPTSLQTRAFEARRELSRPQQWRRRTSAHVDDRLRHGDSIPPAQPARGQRHTWPGLAGAGRRVEGLPRSCADTVCGFGAAVVVGEPDGVRERGADRVCGFEFTPSVHDVARHFPPIMPARMSVLLRGALCWHVGSASLVVRGEVGAAERRGSRSM